MGRKNRARKLDDPGKAQEFQVNPFAELAGLVPKDSLPDARPAKPKPPPKPPAKAALGREDRELLRAFGAEQSLQFDASAPVGRGPAVTLAIQRKGKGGRTVTLVRGLADLDLVARMQLAKDIGQALGTNARFHEETMEIQGDQRERAAAWLAGRGFRPRQS